MPAAQDKEAWRSKGFVHFVFSSRASLLLCLAAMAAAPLPVCAQQPPPSFSFGRENREPSCPIAAPDDDTANTVGDEIWAGRQQAEPFCLFVGARLWIPRDVGRASDLLALGKVRAAYDVARCASEPQVEELLWLVRSTAEEELRAAGGSDAPLLKRFARDPATYRYTASHLSRGCARILPRGRWPEAQRKAEARIVATVPD